MLRELVLGTLRWLRRLDAVIETAAGRRVDHIDRRTLAPLRLGVYQLLFLDRVPPHAAVDEAVRDARRRGGGRGGAGFVNAVLRRVARERRLDAWPVSVGDAIGRLAIEESHPEFLVRRWVTRFGERRTREILAANNARRPLHLLPVEDAEQLARELAGEQVRCAPSPLAPRGLEIVDGDPLAARAFLRGAFYVQDAASQAAALVPAPRPGERVLDAAAAPGGKGFSLVTTEPSVRLTALDRSLRRFATLRRNQARLGLGAPRVVADARRPPFDAVFDRVTVDLPCSGTGTLSRHPELKWRLGPEEIERLAAAGLEILEGLAACVRPGGLLVAITCSIELEENDRVVARLTARRNDLALVPLENRLSPDLSVHIAGEGKWQVLPAPSHDGFTVHVLERT